MAIITGVQQDSLIGQPLADRSYLSDNVKQVFDSTYDPLYTLIPPAALGGVSYQPVIVSYVPKTGVQSDGVNSFLYQRIVRQQGATRLDGVVINVGVIEDSTAIAQTLWNGFKDPITVTNIAYSYPTSDVTVTAPSVSDVFNPYQEKPLDIAIDIAGDPFFDVEITITFSNASTAIFTVRGTRFPVREFTFLSQANWRGGLKAETQYLTSIYKASETSETRQALRNRPVRKMTYEFASVGKDFSTTLWGFMQGLAKRRTYLPMFQDGTPVTQLSNTVKIFCDTVNRRFYAGNTVLIALRRFDRSHTEGTSSDEAMYYTAIINSVSDTFIIVISNPLAEIPKGSMIYPGIYSEIATKDNTFDTFKPTGAIAKVTINEVFGPTTIVADNVSYSPTLFYSDAFLTFDFNWVSFPKAGVKRDAAVLKKGRNPTVIPRTGFSTSSIDAVISVHNRSDWWDLTGFLNYVKGRYRAFWVKHPLDAYRLGSYSLFSGPDITEVEVLTQGGINNMYSIQAVWTKDSNGVETIIKVDAIRAGFTPSSVVLELDPTTVTDIVEIKRAFLMRNTSDKFIERWYTDESVVEVKMSMIELPGAYS